MALRHPHLRGPAARAAIGGFDRQHSQERAQRIHRHLADERDVQDVAVVQHRRGVGDRRLAAGRLPAVDEHRVGRHADGEDCAARGFADRFARRATDCSTAGCSGG